MEKQEYDKKVLSLHGLHSLQSAWSAFWGDPMNLVANMYNVQLRISDLDKASFMVVAQRLITCLFLSISFICILWQNK